MSSSVSSRTDYLVAGERTAVAVAGLGRTSYRPEVFVSGMSLEQMLAATGASGYYGVPVNKGLTEDGTLVFVQGLAAGFEEDGLVYVETLPLGAAGVEPSK